ncbi:nitrite reductase large subunit NirB [Rothia sp. ZJ932]|uniref:nitrite reductase large subunit NirB n=1 Tax=Rothia sp. ZJ932 TaxID=2810516 RepID=UPI0019687255|nr:nitrite reductase large subunit NirB [Rothia sp. ZJ932]QRZ62408.1 FAD-dependent oxidoreductase [Rothia sp. ZJ932]
MVNTQVKEPHSGRKILVVGGGPAAWRFVRTINEQGLGQDTVTVLMDEPYVPYDRVALEQIFNDVDKNLTLGDTELWNTPGIELKLNTRASTLDREARTVTTTTGEIFEYDELIMATGSRAVKIPIPGSEAAHVFRTIDDVRTVVSEVARLTEKLGRAPKGIVVGGGLLGLEAAEGLKHLGAEPTILDVAPWLLSLEMDQGGGHAVNAQIEATGIGVETGAFISTINRTGGEVTSVSVANGMGDEADVRVIDADIVMFAAGIRPNDELVREAEMSVGERGGLLVTPDCRSEEDEHIWAIGEVACILGRTWGLVAPANQMAEVVAKNLMGGNETVSEFDVATKLKFDGVQVAGFGDRRATTPGALEVLFADPARGMYQKIVTSSDAKTLLGGVFVGDTDPFDSLKPLLGRELPAEPAAFLTAAGGGDGVPDTELPDDAILCSCNNIDFGTVRQAIIDGHQDVGSIKSSTSAGTQCGSCVPMIQKTINQQMKKMGLTVSNALCEHFGFSRAELFEAVRIVGDLDDFYSVLERFGQGEDGCAICKPTVASILASTRKSYALDGGRGTLQDTNDRNLANMQKDGTYGVIPRIPGGEITPAKLAVIAQVAGDFGLYTKINGAQRIGMYGARLEQLPEIWKRLVDAGFESGQAYGKSLRNVKSCIGSAWCRFGVQDSVQMAIDTENRYKGLRSPHKFKMGVSGCNRECAEAQGKDVGLIATTNGWNLYLAGNGGANPAHGRLFAKDLDQETAYKYIDRYLMYYIRTADKLQRTARWAEDLDEKFGDAMEHLRAVIIDDSLGICADLDADMQYHIDHYEDEWVATLNDPERMRRFRSFVNQPEVADDASRLYVLERDQIRPATAEELAAAEAEEENAPVLITGAKIPVGAPV